MPEPTSSLDNFAATVQSCINRENPERFWDSEAAFQQLLAGRFLQNILNDELAKLIADPVYFGDWRPAEWVLRRGRGFALSVAVFDSERRYIHALPFFGLYSPLGGQQLDYLRYALPASYNNPVFDPSLSLLPAGGGLIAPGEVLALHTREYAYDFRLPNPVIVLKLSTAPIQPLEWLFRKDTLQAWQGNDADLSSTQLRVAADVLGKFAHQSSLAPLQLLTGHGHHAVRWAAIQNLGRLNRAVALEHLRIACNDPHPHVQRAAQKTLDRMSTTKGQ